MFSRHHITKGTALALALGVIAAPVASANTVTYSRQDKQQITKAGAGPASTRPFDLNASGSYVARAPGAPVGAAQPSNNSSSSTGGQGAPPILSAPTPSQSAAIQRAEQQAAEGSTLPAGARYSNAEVNAYPSGSAVTRASAPDGGFDWGDAGIGAAGALAIAMLAVGGGLAVSQRRARRPATSAVATG
jgi:hypothetical protein